MAVLGARERRLLGRRRARPADPSPEPAPVPTTRVTVIRGQPVDEAAGKDWISRAADVVGPELAVLNRVVHLHRVAAADHAVREVAADQALVVRVGYGAGEQVADGRWTAAVEPPEDRTPLRGRREAALRPQERLAALLGGRDAALACEELVLRARADLTGERFREAALQVRVALEAAIAELEPWRERADLAARIEGLKELRAGIGAAANAALRGGLDPEHVDDVHEAVHRIESALRARTSGGV